MARSDAAPDPRLPAGSVPEGTTELGIDIIKVERIKAAIERFGERFSNRVLTPTERRYVRGRPETFAGRWAAKEAVSKVLGLGVRGIGWKDIEVERLPTGQPAIRLHGRAAQRAEQLGMGRIALSITHESEYAVAVAFGVRTAGGKYVFPLDIDDAARRPRAASSSPGSSGCATSTSGPGRSAAEHRRGRGQGMTDKRPVGFGRREAASAGEAGEASAKVPEGAVLLDDDIVARLVPERAKRGHKGSFGKLLVIAGIARLRGRRRCSCVAPRGVPGPAS